MPRFLALNLESPLQSWAGYSVSKTKVDTGRQPSDRALRGMLAACLGVARGIEHPAVLRGSRIDVTILKQGRMIRDFQTISEQPVGDKASNHDKTIAPHDFEFTERLGKIFAKGKDGRPNYASEWWNSAGITSPGQTIVERTYLADAQFIVTVTGANDDDTVAIADAVVHPVWSPYLGRRAFPPTFPFILGLYDAEPVDGWVHEVERCRS